MTDDKCLLVNTTSLFCTVETVQGQFSQVNLSVIPSSLTRSTPASSSNNWFPGPVKSVIFLYERRVRCWSTDGRNCQKKACEHAEEVDDSGFSLLPRTASSPCLLPPGRRLWHATPCSQESWPQHQMQVPALVRGAAVYGFSLLLTSLCRRLASVRGNVHQRH